MTSIAPLAFDWDGDAMIPLSPKRADAVYVVGQRYRLVPHEDRNANSHRHYFACVHSAWLNLPEEICDRFATSEHLRKWALIRAGYRDERTIVCGSKAEAQRIAAFMKPMDDFAVIVAREATVVAWTAKSQSVKAMGNKTFQESKTKVLDVLSEMIGTDAAELGRSEAA